MSGRPDTHRFSRFGLWGGVCVPFISTKLQPPGGTIVTAPSGLRTRLAVTSATPVSGVRCLGYPFGAG